MSSVSATIQQNLVGLLCLITDIRQDKTARGSSKISTTLSALCDNLFPHGAEIRETAITLHFCGKQTTFFTRYPTYAQKQTWTLSKITLVLTRVIILHHKYYPPSNKQKIFLTRNVTSYATRQIV